MSSSWHGQLNGLEQTHALGRDIAQRARPGDVVALYGELGAGKTQLVKGMAQGLNIDPASVSSPTFVLVHEYEPPSGEPVLVHVDAYRLDDVKDLESLGFNDEMRRGAIVAVEWADRIAGLLGDDRLDVELAHVGEQLRGVECTGRGDWASRVPMLGEPQNAGKCPTCDRPVAAQSEHFPFCSSRCRQVDLSRWFSGDYRITRPLEQRDLEEGV